MWLKTVKSGKNPPFMNLETDNSKCSKGGDCNISGGGFNSSSFLHNLLSR